MKASKVLGLTAALLVIGVFAFLLINMLPSKAPEPLWTKTDLPASNAPSRDNGWEKLKTESAARRLPSSSGVDLALSEALGSATLDEALTHIAALQTPPTTEALSFCQEVFERPTFEDRCPPRIGARCPNLEIHHCHRMLSFACVRTLSTDSTCLEPILRTSVKHARSARSMLSMMVALSGLESSCQLARAAARWKLPAPGSDALRSLNRAPLEPQQTLTYEYLTNLEVIDQLSQNGSGMTAWLFDRGATLETLNARYRAAQKGDFPDERLQSQSGWWLRNAGGKLVLDTLNTPGIMARLRKEHASAMRCIRAL